MHREELLSKYDKSAFRACVISFTENNALIGFNDLSSHHHLFQNKMRFFNVKHDLFSKLTVNYYLTDSLAYIKFALEQNYIRTSEVIVEMDYHILKVFVQSLDKCVNKLIVGYLVLSA